MKRIFLAIYIVMASCSYFPKTQIKALCEATERIYPEPQPNVKCGAKVEITGIEFGGK